MMKHILSVVALVLLAESAVAQTVAPVPFPAFTNATGGICGGCKLETFSAGTSTPLSTYQDSALSTPHMNPIVMTSAGRPTAPIYFSQTAYKLVLKTSAGSTIWTADNVQATPTSLTGVSSSTDIEFRVDTDNNSNSTFKFLNGTSIEKASIDEDGDLQIDGNQIIGDATEADKSLTFDGNAVDFHIGIDDSLDALQIGRGTILGTTPAITVDSAGAMTLTGVVTFPSQPVFSGGATFGGHLIATDNTYDIGASGATRFRDLFLARNAVVGGTLAVTGVGTFTATAVLNGGATVGTDAPATPVSRTIYRDSVIFAWASITNSGSPTIADDLNVASLVDNGVGDVTLTFATANASSTYACIATPLKPTVGAAETIVARIISQSTTAVRVFTEDPNGGTAEDVDFKVICVGE